jgi:hypothetical protein
MPKLKRGKHMRAYMVEVVLKQHGRRERVTAHFIQKSTTRARAELAALRRLRDDPDVRSIFRWTVVEKKRADRHALISLLRQDHVRRALGRTRRSTVFLPAERLRRVVGFPKNARLKDLTQAARL